VGNGLKRLFLRRDFAVGLYKKNRIKVSGNWRTTAYNLLKGSVITFMLKFCHLRAGTLCGLLTLLLEVVGNQAQAVNYYVDNSGSDASSGLSGSPWQHVGYALSNAPAGSSVLLTSGQTFTQDNIMLTTPNIFLTSTGAAPAIIRNSGNGSNVLTVIDASWVTISNLCFYGGGIANTSTWSCIEVLRESKYCTNLTIANCETTNANFGINIYDASGISQHAFDNLTLNGNNVHDIGWDGILVWVLIQGWGGVIVVSNCVTAFNQIHEITGRPDANSGTGLAIMNVSHWECYSNSVINCGYNQGNSGGGGAGGIFPVFYSDHVHIWNNTVAGIRSMPNGGDGVGIDLDQGTTLSTVEGNFVHDCGGTGFYSYETLGNNIWRWNIGINDGTNGHIGEIWFADSNYAPTGSVMQVYQNTFIGGYSAMTIGDPLVGPTGLVVSNILGQIHPGGVLIEAGTTLYTNWYFAGNNYGATNFLIYWPAGMTNVFEMSQWQAIGQECGACSLTNFNFTANSTVIASNYLVQSSNVLAAGGFYSLLTNPPPSTPPPPVSTTNPPGSSAQNILNVTNYGAVGNLSNMWVNCTSNSVLVTTTNLLSSEDIGKVMEIFGGGPLGTSTNHTDLVAIIANVVNGTNIYLDRVTGANTNGCFCVYGNNNASAFQACINAAPSNSVINIPDGNYLVIGSQVLDTNWVDPSLFYTYPSIVISQGGLTLLGQSRTNTILTGCGAWQINNGQVYRGYMFALEGPVTNNGPLVFDTMTLDGGVQQGFTGDTTWPASTATGDGWDVTHDAICDVGTPPLHINKTLRNLTIKNWRGEQLKSTVSGWDGMITITNCSITDGDASGINFSFSHNIENCYFANLAETMEFWQGYCSNACYFQNNFVTNVNAFMAINGAQTNSPNPPYFIQNNTFYGGTGNGIQTCPVQNLTVRSNLFINGVPIVIGIVGYQGTAVNSNIVITANTFTNPYAAIVIEGAYGNSMVGMLVSNNVVYGGNSFVAGYGWGTNMVVVNNLTYGMANAIDSSAMSGQWFLDSSNQFPAQTVYDSSAQSNVVSYAHGAHEMTYPYFNTNSIFVLDDMHPQQVPPGAMMMITNSGIHPATLYLSATMSGTPITMTNGYSGTFYWNSSTSTWVSDVPAAQPSPPYNLHFIGSN